MSDVSVILCSHNPRPDYLARVLDALKAQTLPMQQWELLIVDNASVPPIANEWSLDWHPNARHLREEKLGLTSARLAGIGAAQSDALVFVDDDNELATDYLEEALAIAQTHSFLGAWGGSLRGEFEIPPPLWAKRYLPCLAVREVERDAWSNDPALGTAVPLGAGLCIRRAVAEAYAARLLKDARRATLDRAGDRLLGGGDIDLVRTACRLGMGFGVFKDLRLTHLIPTKRLDLDYMLRMVESSAASLALLDYFDGKEIKLPRLTLRRLARLGYNWITLPTEAWKLFRADCRGAELACAIAKEMPKNGKGIPAA